MKETNLILPHFAFLDDQTGTAHQLEDRTVICQPKTGLVFEVFSNEEPVAITTDNFQKKYSYQSPIVADAKEKHTIVMHVNPSGLPLDMIEEIADMLWAWYSAYLKWEDGNIANQNRPRLN